MSTNAALAILGVITISTSDISSGAAPRTLAVLTAHADDEGPVAPHPRPVRPRGRAGVSDHRERRRRGLLASRATSRAPTSTVQGEELVRQRADEARCATLALGIQPPILLGFPDGKLGDYAGDRALIYRVTQRIAEELGRLRPDAVITWGPDGGTGHPDHRIVSNIVTQLQRAGAPGVPQRVFFT